MWISLYSTAADPTVTYKIISIDNELINSLTVKRSEISFRE
jgi:hypothetical protein